MMGHHPIFFAPGSDSQWTVNRMGRPSQLACTILNPLVDFWPWGHLNTLVYLALINDFEVLQQWVKNACQEIWVKLGIFNRMCISVWQRVKVMLKCRGTIQSIGCRYHMTITCIPAGTGFWTYVDWEFLLIWVLYFLNACDPVTE
jgi:hypothetical protein